MCRSLSMARTTTSPELSPTRICTSMPWPAAQLLGVPAHRLLHAERGVAGAHRVVLVGDRRAEERHDAVAHDLVHRALVAVDRLHHPLEHGIEEPARLLGIAVGEQLHRALEVGEEHGDLLALALEGVRATSGSSRRGAWGCSPGARAEALDRLGGGRASRRRRRTACPGSSSAPQLAQLVTRRPPHSSQNRTPSRFWDWQRGHFTSALLGVGAVRTDSPARVAPAGRAGSRPVPPSGTALPRSRRGLSGLLRGSGGSAGPRPGRRAPGRPPARSAPPAAPPPSGAPSRASRRPVGLRHEPAAAVDERVRARAVELSSLSTSVPQRRSTSSRVVLPGAMRSSASRGRITPCSRPPGAVPGAQMHARAASRRPPGARCARGAGPSPGRGRRRAAARAPGARPAVSEK